MHLNYNPKRSKVSLEQESLITFDVFLLKGAQCVRSPQLPHSSDYQQKYNLPKYLLDEQWGWTS